jgi:hypothetical protein
MIDSAKNCHDTYICKKCHTVFSLKYARPGYARIQATMKSLDITAWMTFSAAGFHSTPRKIQSLTRIRTNTATMKSLDITAWMTFSSRIS